MQLAHDLAHHFLDSLSDHDFTKDDTLGTAYLADKARASNSVKI